MSYNKSNLPMELSESIIDRLQRGEKELFGQLIDVYQDRVYGLSMQLMKNEDDAKEVAQMAFIKIHQKIKLFKGNAKLSVWIYRIAHNEAMSQLKAKRRWIFGFFEQEHNQKTAPPGILAELNQADQQDQIQWAFEQLKSKERLVLQLFYLDELNYEEIVEITQMSLANVKVSLHRAKKKMKLLFDQKEIAINT